MAKVLQMLPRGERTELRHVWHAAVAQIGKLRHVAIINGQMNEGNTAASLSLPLSLTVSLAVISH